MMRQQGKQQDACISVLHSILLGTAGDGTLTSFVGVGPATPPTVGGWTLLSTDTGNTMIHATPLSNGQVLVLERPGNREAPVSSLPPSVLSAI